MSRAITSSARLAEHSVVLLGHSDERRPLAELFELGGPHIGTGRPQSPENIQNCVFYIPFVRHFHGLALGGSGRKRKSVSSTWLFFLKYPARIIPSFSTLSSLHSDPTPTLLQMPS